MGKYDEAEIYILESIKIDRQLDSLSSIVEDLESLGNLYLLTNKFKLAEDAFRESLNVAGAIGFVRPISLLLNGLGRAVYQQGNIDLGKDYFQTALKLAKKTNDDKTAIDIFTSLAIVALDANNVALAEDYLVRTFSLARKLALRLDSLFGLVEVVKLLIKKENIQLAIILSDFIIKSPGVWRVVQDQTQELIKSFPEKSKFLDFSGRKSLVSIPSSLEDLISEIICEYDHLPIFVS